MKQKGISYTFVVTLTGLTMMLTAQEEQQEHLLEASDYFFQRRRYYQASAVVVVLFISGLLLVNTYKTPLYDLSNHYFKDLNMVDKQRSSFYDWSVVKGVSIVYMAEASGMIQVRAENGEILFQSFAERGIEQDMRFEVPAELNTFLLEHKKGLTRFHIDGNQISSNQW